MFRKLQPRIGFGWTVRSLAFVNVGFAILICVIIGREKVRGHKARPLLDMAALRDPVYLSLAASLFFLYLAFYVPLFYVVSYARWSLDTGEDFAFYMLAVVNGGSIIGRTVPYLLGQKVKPIYTLLFSSVLGVILLFCWISIDSKAGFVVWCVFWGFVSGVLVTGPTSTIPHPVLSPSMDVIGTRMGMGWAACSIGTIAGSPIAGALANVAAGDFLKAQIFAGVVMAVGSACLMPPLVAIERHDKAKAQ
jgi:fucose permease